MINFRVFKKNSILIYEIYNQEEISLDEIFLVISLINIH